MNVMRKLAPPALGLTIGALSLVFLRGWPTTATSIYSRQPLPTIEATLRPGVEWVTFRNLPGEASTIWQEQGQVYGFSRPLIEDVRDAAAFRDLVGGRLGDLPMDRQLVAEVTLTIPLSLTQVTALVGEHNILSLLSISQDGSTGRSPYPPHEPPNAIAQGFGSAFQALSGGTPAPELNPDSYIALRIQAQARLLRALAYEPRVFSVDIGPVDLDADFPGGVFTPLKDVSFDYEAHVRPLCDFATLSTRIEELVSQGEILDAELADLLLEALGDAKVAASEGDADQERIALASYFDSLALASRGEPVQITEGATKELSVVGECLVATDSLIAFPEWLPPLSLAEPYVAQAGSTIPVKFSVSDLHGQFVESEVLSLTLFDSSGNVVVGPIEAAMTPSQGIAVTGHRYHYDLRTRGLPAGSYSLMLAFESPVVGGSTFRTIELVSSQ
jgi:hypothetical protein